MLSTPLVHVCVRGGSERLRKNGHAINGAQRAKCPDCERTFILQPGGELYEAAFKTQVLSACQDRLSLRGIQRTFAGCYKTVMRWWGGKNREPARLHGDAAAQREGRRA